MYTPILPSDDGKWRNTLKTILLWSQLQFPIELLLLHTTYLQYMSSFFIVIKCNLLNCPFQTLWGKLIQYMRQNMILKYLAFYAIAHLQCTLQILAN